MKNVRSERLFEDLLSINNIRRSIILGCEYLKNTSLYYSPNLDLFELNIDGVTQEIKSILEKENPPRLIAKEYSIPHTYTAERIAYHFDILSVCIFFCFGNVLQEFIKNRQRENILVLDTSNLSKNNKSQIRFLEIDNEFEQIKTDLYPNEYPYVLALDISNFYETISHSNLINLIASKLKISEESRFLLLFRDLLTIKVESPNGAYYMDEGVYLGMGIEDYLSNLYLDGFDRLMNSKEKVKYVRYVSDDLFFYCKSYEDIRDCTQVVNQELRQLDLRINLSKTKVFSEQTEGYDFEVFRPDAQYMLAREDRQVFFNKDKLEITYDSLQSLKNKVELMTLTKDNIYEYLRFVDLIRFDNKLNKEDNLLAIKKISKIIISYSRGSYLPYRCAKYLLNLTLGKFSPVDAPNRAWPIITFNVEKSLDVITYGLSILTKILKMGLVSDFVKYSILKAIFEKENERNKHNYLLRESYYLFFNDCIDHMDEDIHDHSLGTVAARYRIELENILSNLLASQNTSWYLREYIIFIRQKQKEFYEVLSKESKM